jgi:RND family efflux transporter MFP subunit
MSLHAPRDKAGMRVAAGSLLACVLTAASGCQKPSQEEVETTNAVPVVVVAAHVGDIRAEVRAAGLVTPAPGAELVVVAPAPARIATLPHGEGDRVRRGELLVRFDAPNLQADAAARRADLGRGEARLAAARASLARLVDLFDRGVAAKKEVEDARRELADAEADVATARSGLRAAADLGARAEVRAPFDGIVSARLHNAGDLVDASASDPVLRFVDPARLQVEAGVPLADLPAVAVGQTARVLGTGSVEEARGTVMSRPGLADPMTGAAKVRVGLPLSARLAANSPVEVVIETVEHRGVVLIPQGAVVQEGPETFVYVVTADKHAHRRPLQVGIVAGGEVEVRAGVHVGEQVIVQGQTGLPDDAAVVPSGGSSR